MGFKNLLGVEINDYAVSQAKKLHPEVDIIKGSAFDLPFRDNYFDLVYSGQSIEHITEPECDTVLREVYRVLKPNGFFCVDTPNAKATRLQQKDFIDPDHKIEYTHPQFSEKLIQAGFQIEEAKGMNYLNLHHSDNKT